MKHINESLFKALKKKFGKVQVTNAGIEAKYHVVEDKVAAWASARNGNPDASTKRVNLINWGETYAVNCPRCNDKRSRLYISHIWGTHCEQANKKLFSCVKCHNESCYWGDLWNVLFGTDYDPAIEQKSEDLKTGVDADAKRMELPGPVEDLIPINQLAEDHPVIQYLISRNFTDINMLANEYQFCFCNKSPWQKRFTDSGGNWHTITPQNRLIIPNVQQGVWQGWMARYIGDIPKDPNSGKPVIQKYLNAPGYSFSSSVYRLESAKAFSNGDFCIVCEGALSAIACGFAGVCTFGMYPRPMQEELLANTFKDGQIVFMVEHEAAANKRIFDVIARLNDKVAKGCLAVELAKGKDPASMTTSELMEAVINKQRNNHV